MDRKKRRYWVQFYFGGGVPGVMERGNKGKGGWRWVSVFGAK